MIKFLDINKQDKPLKKKIFLNIKKVINKKNFILGDYVEKFEKNFAKFCKAKYAISCANGTDALTIALKILNLPKNSEVIIPAMTYCSTAFAVINAGLKPVLIDITSFEPTISIDKLKNAITDNTKVIMPVHLYGSVSNILSIRKLIKDKKIFLIDDCSQAHGAYDGNKKLKRNKVGSIADISCFSLYPGKNLGAYGDAGIITTNNKKLYKIIKNIRNLGSEKKFIHNYIGVNSRLDTIQAIILNKKLKNLERLNLKRKKIADIYDKKILNDKIIKLEYSRYSVYHQYVILVKERDKLIRVFNKKKIQYNFHYPFAIHQLKIFRNYFKKEKYINAERLAKEGISIPIDPNLLMRDVATIVNTLNKF